MPNQPDYELIVPAGLEVRNLADRLAEIIRNMIILGDIEPDVAIKQDVLAAQLKVSKIPLREALSRLEQDGLVKAVPNRGFIATSMTMAEAEEVFALRLKIEPDAAAKASFVATDADHAEAARALDDLEAAAAADDPRVGVLHRRFHIALVKPAGRHLTTDLIARLHAIAERYVRKHLEPPGRPGRARDEHYEMLGAWRAGEASEVRKKLRAHISNTAKELRHQLKVTAASTKEKPRANKSVR